ncbi:hypothetical protein FVE85_1070 [Porphyridium purpureum]|uniref:Uncharacterized protein n=1 Tax=Porphyridium purpureum TaxID=35688 RepID=A0A5J4Z0G2_PORPP|nr:hypothetical protein FVE85_1070 [Porphyridium purpureum]|eukprot:POR7423..scf208_2
MSNQYNSQRWRGGRGSGRHASHHYGNGGGGEDGYRNGGAAMHGRPQHGAANSHRGRALDSQEMVYEQAGGAKYVYYQDRTKKWAFQTSKEGADLLLELVKANEPLLAWNLSEIDKVESSSRHSRESVLEEGRRMYADKNSMKNEGVTWSIDEYGHLGLQAQYLRLKSFQRFTETWTMLERAQVAGVFAELEQSDEEAVDLSVRQPVRVASIGGGPAFELLAFQKFFARHFPHIQIEYRNLDLQPGWKTYSEMLGFPFRTWDINDANLHEACGWQDCRIDYVLISYVLIHVAKTPGVPQHEAVCESLCNYMKQDGVRAMLVCERSPRNRSMDMIEARGIQVLRLMSQRAGADERQTVWRLPPAKRDPEPLREAEAFRSTLFPNVPYEEYKDKDMHGQGKRGGNGGSFGDASHGGGGVYGTHGGQRGKSSRNS